MAISEKATKFWAQVCLDTKIAFVNCMPAFIASDKEWAQKFTDKNIPIIGDDIKGQVGATIVHRTLARLCDERGTKIEKTYQINVGGNTDFLNMKEQERLVSKKISKTESVQSQLTDRLDDDVITNQKSTLKITNESGSGVLGTSEPRILRSQAIDSGEDKTTASSSFCFSVSQTIFFLSMEDFPE